MAHMTTEPSTLAAQIDALLPQTQCEQCGYHGCRPYAEAIASSDADNNQCPPGGQAGIDALAETDTALALPFLEQQLERREQASDARDAGDVAALERMVDAIRDESRTRERVLAERLDAHDVDAARADVRELKFLQKVAEDVEAMIATIDG